MHITCLGKLLICMLGIVDRRPHIERGLDIKPFHLGFTLHFIHRKLNCNKTLQPRGNDGKKMKGHKSNQNYKSGMCNLQTHPENDNLMKIMI
jgi:hypothetical protein